MQNSYVKYTRFKGAWQKAYLNSITVSTIGDDQSAIAAVEANTAQVFSAGGNVDDIPIVHGAKGISTLLSPPVELNYIHLLDDKPPFNNIDARKALAQAIDTPLIARELYSNRSQWTQSMETPESWAFDGVRVRGYPQYNPAAAAADVAALPGGKLSFTMLTESTPYNVQQAEAIIGELQAIPGISVNLEPLALTSLLSAQHAETYQASDFTTFPLSDPDFMYYRNFCSCSNQNQEAYSDPAFDNLVNAARETFSEPQRKVLYEKAQLILAKDLPVIPLFATPTIYIVNNRVHNFPAVFTSTADLTTAWLS